MPLTVDTAIPAGNGLIDAIEGDVIRLRPDVRTTTEPWFWWHIRVQGCAGRRLRVEMGVPWSLTVRGAVVSRDQGRTWDWIDGYDPSTWEFSVEAGPHDELRLALAVPYTRRDLDAWLAWHTGHPALRVEELCRSRSGAAVPLLVVGRQDGSEARQALIACRHHCCESLASFVLEGLLDAVLAGDALGRRLIDRWRLLVVPMVDYDGVQAGDQGKRRAPHDHNADYTEAPIHPEIAAIQALLRARCDGRLHAALDLHCPWVRGSLAEGGTNEHIYIVGNADPDRARLQREFGARLERLAVGPLPYRVAGTMPYGKDWNVVKPDSPLVSYGRHLSRQAPPACTVATFEFPYGDVEGHAVTPAGARAFGRDLARALDDLG